MEIDEFAEGLVDANSEDEFDRKLETLYKRGGRAIEERNAAIKPGFGSWFSQYKAEIRGSPPHAIYNQF